MQTPLGHIVTRIHFRKYGIILYRTGKVYWYEKLFTAKHRLDQLHLADVRREQRLRMQLERFERKRNEPHDVY